MNFAAQVNGRTMKPMKIIKRLFCKIGWHSFPAGYDLVEYDGYHGRFARESVLKDGDENG